MTQLLNMDISAAAEIIKNGGLVAVPTETVYGLAGNGLDAEAVEKIYEVKGRPAIKPLSLMVPDKSAIELYCEDVPEAAFVLADKFWPGPLTIVLKSKDIVPDIVRAGGTTVGLRCPDHPMTLSLLKMAAVPFAAPSANPSDKPSPKNAAEVMAYFDGVIDCVIDGGDCGIGRESTIIDMSSKPYKILRQGALAEEEVERVLVDNMSIVGITGPTGCGKTTALDVLSDMGALTIDCDEVYHRLLREDKELVAELDSAFPGTVTDGKLDRKALGAIVFRDAAALKRLNSIAHRYISKDIDKQLKAWALSGGTLAALDAIELISSGISNCCDILVGVLSDKLLRAKRIMVRDGIDEKLAMLRINAQHDDDYFVDNCSHIIYNNDSENEFRDRMINLLLEVL